MSTLNLHANTSKAQGTWVLPEPQGRAHPVSQILRRLTHGQGERIERTLARISRGETGGATFTWIDFSITIRWVAGRLVLSLFSHDHLGSVVGYVVEEILGHDSTVGFDFAGREWRLQS